MKRRDLIRHLLDSGCELFREGGRHSLYVNRQASRSSAIPRHNEINNFLTKKICQDLGVPMFTKK